MRIELVNIRAAEIQPERKLGDCFKPNFDQISQNLDNSGENKAADSSKTLAEISDTKGGKRENTREVEKSIQLTKKTKRTKGRPPQIARMVGTREALDCEWCDKAFNEKGALKRHILTKHAEQLLKCETCECAFAVEEDLAKHVRVKHKPIQCSECPKTFKTMTGFKLHRFGHHKDALSRTKGETRIHEVCVSKCSICHEFFHSKRKLSEHHLEAHGTKPFDINACAVCGKAFTTKHNLLAHSATHSNVHQFLCTFCGKSFKRAGHLKDHLDLHSPEPKYQCNVCGKKITTKSNLNSHMYKHKTIREYTCEYCGKAFKNNSKLKAHVDIHLNERRHKCEFCGKGFNNNGTLWLHRKNVHHATKNKVEITSSTD